MESGILPTGGAVVTGEATTTNIGDLLNAIIEHLETTSTGETLRTLVTDFWVDDAPEGVDMPYIVASETSSVPKSWGKGYTYRTFSNSVQLDIFHTDKNTVRRILDQLDYVLVKAFPTLPVADHLHHDTFFVQRQNFQEEDQVYHGLLELEYVLEKISY